MTPLPNICGLILTTPKTTSDAKPLEIGNSRKLVFQDSRIDRHAIGIGNYDLTELLDRKCGGSGI